MALSTIATSMGANVRSESEFNLFKNEQMRFFDVEKKYNLLP